MPVTYEGSINFRFDEGGAGGIEANMEVIGDYHGSVAKQEVHGTDSFTYTYGHGTIVFTHGEDHATLVTTLGDQEDSSGPWTAHHASVGYTCSDTKLTLRIGGADGTVTLTRL